MLLFAVIIRKLHLYNSVGRNPLAFQKLKLLTKNGIPVSKITLLLWFQ